MLYLTCTIISSVDLAHYGVFCAKDRVSVDCGTISFDVKVFVQTLMKIRYSDPLNILGTVFFFMH